MAQNEVNGSLQTEVHQRAVNAKAVVRRLARPFKLSQEKKENYRNVRGVKSRTDVAFQHLGHASNRTSLIAGSFSDYRAICSLPVLVIIKIS